MSDLTEILTPAAIKAIAKSIVLEMEIIEQPFYLSRNKALKKYGTKRFNNWLMENRKIRQNILDDRTEYRFEDLERCAIEDEYIKVVKEKRKYQKN